MPVRTAPGRTRMPRIPIFAQDDCWMAALDIERIRVIADCDGLVARLVDEIPSTNEALMDAGFGRTCAPPTLLVAAHQTAGRGRRGRNWVSERGRSLTFSLALERLVDTAAPPAAASIVCGVAAADALAPWLPGIGLKWPNDLWIGAGKLGGILVETRRSAPLHPGMARCIERLVVGIGINLAAPREDRAVPGARGLFDPVGAEDAPDGRAGAMVRDDPEILIGCIAGEVVRALNEFFTAGLAPFIPRWQRRDVLMDETIVVLDGASVLARGRAIGLDPGGALRLLGAHGVERIQFGEVSVRRESSS